MFKTHYNKVYNYVQNKSAFEILMDGVCASLFVIAVTGFTGVVYNLIFNSPTITFGGW